MSVAQRGKFARWPSAGGPVAPGSGLPAARRSLSVSLAAERDAALRWLENRDGGRSVAWFRRMVRAVWHRCSYLNAPILYSWSASRRATGTVHDLHRTAMSLLREEHDRGFPRLWLWIKVVIWPLLATVAIGPLLWRCGRRVQQSHGLSLGAQARDLLTAAWCHGIFPTEYYHRRIFRRSPEIERTHYLPEREQHALLADCVRGIDASRVNSLSRFMVECRLAGLPTPRTHAVALQGQVESLTGAAPETLPPRDLFLRPARWTGSTSGQHWRWNRPTNAWIFRDESLSASGLFAHAARLAASQPWVLHEAISNHPDISRFAAGGVCTARIATGLDESGQPQVLFAALHLPASTDGGWGPAPGELVAGIDVATGRLDAALDEFVSDGEFAVHPGTGMTIAGTVLPQWPAFCELALRAHRTFNELPFVGWRIALSGGGPVLVDAGTDWGVFRHVWPAQTSFAPWCLQWLAARSARAGGNAPMTNAELDVAPVAGVPGG